MKGFIWINPELPREIIGDVEVIKKLKGAIGVCWLTDEKRINGINYISSLDTNLNIREYYFSGLEDALTAINKLNDGSIIPSLPVILHARLVGETPTDNYGNINELSSTVRQDVEEKNMRYWIHQAAINDDGTYRKGSDDILQADSRYLGIVVPVSLEDACRENTTLAEWSRNYPKDFLAATLLNPSNAIELDKTVQQGTEDSSAKAVFEVTGLSKPGIVPVSFYHNNSFSFHYSDSAGIEFGKVGPFPVHRVEIKELLSKALD